MTLFQTTAAASLLLALAVPVQADAIDDYVRAQMAKNHIPAVSVAVVRDGTVTKLGSYGVANVEWDVAATDDTRYQLASATKPFTGLLLLQLVEQGRLGLDDSITRFFPEAPEAWKPVTVRHLAAHTSGLPEVDAATAEAIVAAAMRQPLAHPPGTVSAYGFTDYVVLAAILGKVSGKAYPDLLRDSIAVPLAMTATAFDNAAGDGPIRTADVLPRRAGVYRWEKGTQRRFDFLYGIPGYAAGVDTEVPCDVRPLGEVLVVRPHAGGKDRVAASGVGVSGPRNLHHLPAGIRHRARVPAGIGGKP